MMTNILGCFRGGSSSQLPLYPELDPNQAEVHTFEWNDMVNATQGFNNVNLIGQGNFGKVYRFKFRGVDQLGAVKIQKLEAQDAQAEFDAEINTLHRADHPNLIRLIGNVLGPNHRGGLVYEYMPNGSLDRHLYAGVRRGPALATPLLDWHARMRIAGGVARALRYLHIEMRMLHLDVKIGNVLLDEHFMPKLTDFGLATEMAHGDNGQEKPFEMNVIKGTPGCIAPETQESGSVSTKSDVYSYEVFLLQLFTGRKAFDHARPEETRKIADWFVAERSKQNVTMLVDPKIGVRFPSQGLNKLIVAVMMCIHPDAPSRPDMASVAVMVSEAADF